MGGSPRSALGVLIFGVVHADQRVILEGSDYGLSAATTDLLASDLKVTEPSVLRLQVAVITTNSTLVLKKDDGTNDLSLTLNSGTALTAGNLYSFTVHMIPDVGYNFQLGSLTTCDMTYDHLQGGGL